MAGRDDVRAASPTAVKLTYDDFVHFPDDGQRHELIDGEHYVTPSPNTKHQRVSGNLFFLIVGWLEDHPLGQMFYAPYDVVFSAFDVVEPDLLYLSNERAAQVLTPLHAKGVPELVVEIASKGTKRLKDTKGAKGQPLKIRARGSASPGRSGVVSTSSASRDNSIGRPNRSPARR